MVDRVCKNPNCHKPFQAKAADVKRGWAKCCSKSCAAWIKAKAKGNHGQLFDKHGAYQVRYKDDPPTFCNAHHFSNEEHDCNKS